MQDHESGFTLIELSIVLVIIGLIVGGILTGRDLIDIVFQRAQISQIEKYNTAVHTFRNKYGYLPGDIPGTPAAQFGFQPRGSLAGEGDGNGIIEGNGANMVGQNKGADTGDGEPALFWVDLTNANLIDQAITVINGYPSANTPYASPGITSTTSPTISQFLPIAKLGNNNFVYIFSANGTNYFGVSSVTNITYDVASTANPGITVQQAYNIDSKIDDGMPQLGGITACYVNSNVTAGLTSWAAGGNVSGAGSPNCASGTGAVSYAATNCYDNNGVAGNRKYSLTQNATVQNCALSFKFR
ncbi:MAG TPA: prepilin-type N-terminal cleavage/methylation domain-containing protein [Rickettsiales bacterium]|nr:prepilin-type N-terminal cleavage/methylation domain-containing protein [Rickettsiales bacterium]